MLDIVVFLALREELLNLVYVTRATLFLPNIRVGMPSTSSRVTGSSVVASLLTDLTVVLEEDSTEGLKSTVSNLRLSLAGSSLETDYKAVVGSSIKVVEETITSFYSKGLLSYYRKSSLA